MSSVSESGDTESETHSGLIQEIGSHSVKLTLSRREILWVLVYKNLIIDLDRHDIGFLSKVIGSPVLD